MTPPESPRHDAATTITEPSPQHSLVHEHEAHIQEHAYARRWLILAVLCFSLLVIILDNSILNVAIPTIIRDLDATSSQVQWMIDSYVLVFAGLLLTMGSLGDRFGRRGALQVGFVIFGIGSLASSLADSAGVLIGTRAVMGIGGALIMPATLSIITNVFPPQERGRAIGVWAGVAGLGGALGPLIGGFLVEHFYWGSVFLVNIPIVLVGLVAGFLIIPTSKDPSAPPLDLVGALLSIVGLTMVLYAIIEAPSEGWTAPATVIPGSLGVLLLVSFALWERHCDHPMLDVRFFRNPRFSAASSAISLVFFALFGSIFLLTQYFQFVLGYTPLQTGVRMMPFALTMMVVAPTSARVVERIGSKITVSSGMVMITAGLLTLGWLQTDTPYPNIIWRLMLIAAGMGLVMAPATDSVMGSLPLAKAGVGSAVNDTTRQVGGALGVAVIGSVSSTVFGTAIADLLAGTAVPAAVVEQASTGMSGVADAVDALGQAPNAGTPAIIQALVGSAKSAFVSGLHRGVLVAAVFTLVGAVLTVLYLPARPSEVPDRSADGAGADATVGGALER